jgi:hypothetical protein
MEMSALSDYDFICLVATYNDLTGQEKNKVSSKVKGRGYTEEQLAQTRQTFSEKFNPVVSCGLQFLKPFDHLRFEPIGYVLTLYENYERGRLPFPGSVSEQPAQVMEIFSVLRQLKHEAEIKLRETSKQNGRN